jgi:predicted metal-dependent phosphoesterase TrpH
VRLDLHCHSVSSDDARATVEQYLKWIQVLRKKGHQVDGIVLTEHRKFDRDADYRALSDKYGVLVLKGSEVDTRHGHFLVYGVTEALLSSVNFADVAMDPNRLIEEAAKTGGIAVPAHPGRVSVGLVDHLGRGAGVGGFAVAELLNGGSRHGEEERAHGLFASLELQGTGGSDAHFPSAIATCMTEFAAPVRTEADLVEALRARACKAVRLENRD